MDTDTFDIQKLVQESGIPRRTIYFYVQQGILPPPEGAGLAAYYTEEHLLRLQMIPILRRQGLRLDEIRQRLNEMTLEELRRAVAAPVEQPEAPQLPAVQPPALREARAPFAARLAKEAFTHYILPGGVMIVAPGALSREEEDRLNRLLEAAAQIYLGLAAPDPGNGRARPDSETAQEEK